MHINWNFYKCVKNSYDVVFLSAVSGQCSICPAKTNKGYTTSHKFSQKHKKFNQYKQ